nr:hypothetical protein GCM10010200_015550 [Actinomadura rugatobispora]
MEEAPELIASCSAVTKIVREERESLRARYGQPVSGGFPHSDLLCESQAGHPGRHVLLVNEYEGMLLVWLHWDDEGAREFASMPGCPAEIPMTDTEPGECCTFPAEHWGAHSYETDHFARSREWWSTHEPWREEREALYAALSSGTGVLGPGPGYYDGTGYWLSGYPPTSGRAR